MRFLALLAVMATPTFAETPSITLQITFAPAATAKLTEIGEKVTVSAYYFGEPSDENTLPLDNMGQVVLAEENFTIEPTDQEVVVGAALADAPVNAVTQTQLNVNIFGAGQGSMPVTLWCGIIDTFVAEADGKTFPIRCQLMGG